jgi:type IV secretory pathway TraG/TraD family ATPase VirD4
LDFLADENVGDDCAVLADMLVLQTGQEKDPHWNDKARAILKGLILYVVGAGKPRIMAELRRVVVEELCNSTVVGPPRRNPILSVCPNPQKLLRR